MIKFKKDKKNYRLTLADLQLAKEKIRTRITRLQKVHGGRLGAKESVNNWELEMEKDLKNLTKAK